ncbi:MAG TPA: hypothetical protein PKN08_07745, partial [Opitutaceae bacterium]|nr:hypothetical protein [Opitutaceae bacterium]
AEKALALTQQHATNLAGQVEQLQSREADLTAQLSHWRQNFETVAEDHRLASLHIAHLDREIVRVREEGEARLQALKETWSWKLTVPVRALRRFLQRCGVRC